MLDSYNVCMLLVTRTHAHKDIDAFHRSISVLGGQGKRWQILSPTLSSLDYFLSWMRLRHLCEMTQENGQIIMHTNIGDVGQAAHL